MSDRQKGLLDVLREPRAKPILQLMEWIKRYVMQRCCAKREGLKNFDGVIMPSVVKMIHKGLEQVTNMHINHADLHEFEVDDGDDTFVVNLETKSCGCYRWSLMGIPCRHALACISKRRLNYEEFFHPAYHVSTYAPTFKAMLGQNQWEAAPYPQPLPPPYVKMSGRPSKKKRIKEQCEDQEKQQVKRAKKQNRCNRCGGLGHYKTRCQQPPLQTSETAPTPKGRPKKVAATTLQLQASTSASHAPQPLSQSSLNFSL